MSSDTLSLMVDFFFAAAGIALVVARLRRRPRPSAAESAPPATRRELLFTLAGLVTAAVGPNVLVVALTPGMPEMPFWTRYALLPSIGLLAAVWAVAALGGYDRLTNRIWVGLWAGAAATGVLDAFRLTGFHLGQMPGNMPRMFGVLILDRMALGPTLGSDILGYLYHFWAGACFGLAFTLLMGRFPWWGALIWGLIIELGMMTTPPMVVAMDTGYFGAKFGPGLFATSFTAHVAFGITLGLLVERYVRHDGTLLQLLKNRSHGFAGGAVPDSSRQVR